PKTESRMPWEPNAGGYLETWLVCGEFPNPPHEGAKEYDHTPPCVGLDTDYLAEQGGETAIVPVAGMRHKRPDGTFAPWFAHTAPGGRVDFVSALRGRPTSNVVAYAYRTIESDQGGKAMLSVGSDDGIRIWLNDAVVHDHILARGVHPDEDVVPVDLRKGSNRLLVKVEQGSGGWGFILRTLTESEALALDPGEIAPTQLPAPEGKPDTLVVTIDSGMGARLRPDEPVDIVAVAPNYKAVIRVQKKRSDTIALDTADWPVGPYELRLSHVLPDGATVTKYIDWYRGDWQAQVKKLLAACDALPPRPTKEADLRLQVVGAFVRDRLGENVAADGWKQIHGLLMEHQEIVLGDDATNRPHAFRRLAWRDPVDDSAQYARAFLPTGYDAKKPWPMVVRLHGYNPPNPEYIRWWGVTNRHSSMADREGVIVLEPHGRANTGYNGIGDTDVLRAMAEAKAKFNVDADRVYLMGYSMGGGGTWHVGTRHPEAFAAIGPVYGGWDYHTRFDADDYQKLTPEQRFDEERWSSFAQADSLLTTPVFVNHGDDDTLVDVDHSRYAVRMLQRWGYNIRYWEHPGKGHGALGCETELVRAFLSHRRDAMPRRVRVRSGWLETASAHWVRVEQSEAPRAFIVVDARVADRHTIVLNTQNALEVRLTPGEPILDRKSPVRVVWNGRSGGPVSFKDGAIVLRAPEHRPGRLAKTPGVSGPIEDVQTTPFVIVRGTVSKDPVMRRFCQMRAEAIRDQWQRWQHATPRYALDTDLTDDQAKSLSLILVGGPEANAVTARLIDGIPLELHYDSIVIGSARFNARDAAVQVVCPNPLNADRYVTVIAANSGKGMFFADQLPGDVDFAISDGRVADEEPGHKLLVVSGSFDHAWEYREAFARRGDVELRRAARVRNAPQHMTADVDGPVLHVSDLLEAKAAGGFADMQRDRNAQGKPIVLDGKTYARGLGLRVWHEACTVTYDIADAGWERLRATLGIEVPDRDKLEQKQKDGTRVFFIVRGDGEELYRSPVFGWDAKAVRIDVDVAGVKELQLEVGNEVQWHNAARSIDWAALRLERTVE
ncbi:NPCBM/NEW2 domain-containing protein, partial [bacterium]|nr:NPCBM/NEW2 domain-containing protein [bacterium]